MLEISVGMRTGLWLRLQSKKSGLCWLESIPALLPFFFHLTEHILIVPSVLPTTGFLREKKKPTKQNLTYFALFQTLQELFLHVSCLFNRSENRKMKLSNSGTQRKCKETLLNSQRTQKHCYIILFVIPILTITISILITSTTEVLCAISISTPSPFAGVEPLASIVSCS